MSTILKQPEPVNATTRTNYASYAGLAVLLSLAMFVVLLIVAGQVGLIMTEAEFATLMALFATIIAPVLISAIRQRFDPLEPINVMVIAIAMSYIIGPLLMLSSGTVQRNGIELRDVVQPSWMVGIVGLIGFYAGYAVIRTRRPTAPDAPARMAHLRPRIPEAGQVKVDRAYTFYAALAAWIATVLIVVFWARQAELPLTALNALADEGYGYNIYAYVSQTSTLYLFYFIYSWKALLVLAWVTAPNPFWKRVVFALYVLVGLVYTLMGSRGTVVTHVVFFGVLWFLQRGKLPSVRLVMAAAIATVLAVGYIVILRVPGYGVERSITSVSWDTVIGEAGKELTERGAFVATMQVVKIFPDFRPFLETEIFETVVVNIVPRSLWPDKPTNPRPVHTAIQPYSRDLNQLPAYDWFAYYYAGYGPVGTFAGLFGFGVFSAAIYTGWKRNPASLMRQIILALWLPTLFVVFHRGDLVFFLIQLAYDFIPPLAVWYFTTRVLISSRAVATQ